MRIKSDSFRQILNVIAAPLMWILSTLPQVVDIGRTAKEFSDINDSLLVPYGIAFAIWFPILLAVSDMYSFRPNPSIKHERSFET